MPSSTYTTDSMPLAATLQACGYVPTVEMVTSRKANFVFSATSELEDLVRRYGKSGKEGLFVEARELFASWSHLRAIIQDRIEA